MIGLTPAVCIDVDSFRVVGLLEGGPPLVGSCGAGTF